MTLPQSWSKQEICDAFAISPKEIDRLVKSGKVGYYRAGRSRRFFAEHVDQIREALTQKPTPPQPVLHGLTPGSAARRRRLA